ncbi:MAG TPA: methyltransferase domain-containing protein [Acidimicrobiales bacterium]
MTTTPTLAPDDIKAAAGQLVGHAAGYVAARTVDIGLRLDLFSTLADADGPLRPAEFADRLGLDFLYATVWLRSAHAAGVIELVEGGYELPDAMAVALLAEDHPAHTGSIFGVLGQPELFDIFTDRLGTGERLWWDDCSPEFIAAVSATGRPFYNRLVPGGLDKVPGAADILAGDCTILELATGAGRGLIRMAGHYPNATFAAIDGDAFSIDRAQLAIKEAGIDDRVEFTLSTFEEFERPDAFDLAVINISMHECRDLQQVAANVLRSLRPGGIFVVSDFPFPTDDDTSGLRTPAGRVMSGIQFFEALIDDQLLPTTAFVDLLNDAGFADVASFDLSPVHAVTYGRRPA